MKRKMSASLVMLVLIGMTSLAANASEQEKKPYRVGDVVEPFQLKDVNGKGYDLGKYLGEKIIVVDFWNFQCPVSRGYEERLKALYDKFGPKKAEGTEEEKNAQAVFFVIDSNEPNSEDAIKKYAEENKLPYAILKDWKNVIADKFGAGVTPETFVIGKDKKIQYHGSIDDSQNVEKVKEKYLQAAVEALLKGEKPAVSEKKSFGCSIKRI
ncbi:MAG: redoxin domain-containing protein [Candidatus Omnitrophota bacterium]